MTKTSQPLRKSIQGAYANAGLWGLGSGLASMTLVIYFAREFQASGRAIAWLLAAPSLVGLLRLWAPRWLHRVGSRRRFCIGMFLASSAALASLPAVAAPGVMSDSRHSVLALGVTWTTYQVLEFIGVVVLWSWLGDLVPERVRGRFIGRREAWTTAGAVAGSIAAAGATLWWARHCESIEAPELVWKGYAACASFGAALLALATLPLVQMIEPPLPQSASRSAPALRDLFAPWADPRFRRFMYFGLWYSMANGLTQSPRNIFIASVLKVDFAAKRTLDGASRGVQVLLLPWIGAIADRRGNIPVLVASWAIVSLGSVFFLLATPGAKWWIAGAYVCWIAYAGLNVTLPNLMLGLSPAGESAAYAASWFAWTNVAYATSVMAGGWLLDALGSRFESREILGWRLDHYSILFAASSILMAVGVGVALRVPEATHLEKNA
jgi:MFS family permease